MVLNMADAQGIPVREGGFETKSNLRTREDVDLLTKEAVAAYVSVAVDALQSMDVPTLEAVLLYGSRARSDYTVESDADLALVLKGKEAGRALRILEDLGQKTHEIEANYGSMVSPTIIWSEALDSPALSSNPACYRYILNEGIAWDF